MIFLNYTKGIMKVGNTSFLQYHFSDMKEGGQLALLRKARTLLKLLWFMLLPITLLPFLPAVLIVRILRPFVLIRFGILRSKNIGHFAPHTELYMCRRDVGMENPKAIDIFYHESPICNQQMKIMWERILHVSPFARPMDVLNRSLPFGKKHEVIEPARATRDIHGLLKRVPAHLVFTPEEERFGRERLVEMGIPGGASFVCFHARDEEYHKGTDKRDFSHTEHRSSCIHNHIASAEEITRRGYYAVRMGAIVKEPLKTTNPMIIDYATKYHSDFMDMFLCAKCYFYIGDQCGLEAVPLMFRRPVATVNLSQFQRIKTWDSTNVCITKKVWLQREGRFITFREIFDWGIDNVKKNIQYERLGVEPVENTPEEIKALAVEMDERLKGTWQTTEGDEKLQKRFWSIFKPHPVYHGTSIVSHVGAEFLRQNRELLD